MRALVIGGTGFIGPHIVRRLLESGHHVTVLHRGGMEAELSDAVRHVHADISSLPEDHGIEADVVIHVYALTEQDAVTAVRLFRGRTAKMVVLSSGDVYRAYGVFSGFEPGSLEPVPIDEESPLRTKLHPYGGDYEKILVERTVMNAGLPACVLRLPKVYGPGDRHVIFRPWVKRMMAGEPTIPMGEDQAAWRWTHGYVENVADAIALAACDGRTARRIYNIGESDVPTSKERAEALGRSFGWRGQVVTCSDSEVPEELRMPYNLKQHMLVSTARFRAELDFRDPVPLETGLSRTLFCISGGVQDRP
ncbi:MAG TPA: NAD-dependent epimerase/dehydratase family protein [Bryobacteraceae bacterium]|nr:NAD-dependent epimerase/dehydratase family protein [Bryobacteraceae bacterium]